MRNKHFAILALIAASIIWGLTGPIMKQTLFYVPIFSLAFIRFAVASVVIFPFVANRLSIDKKDVLLLIIYALFGVTFNITFFFWGLTLTSALNSGIIVSTIPIFTLLAAELFLKEKVTKNIVIGSLIGMLGIGIIIGRSFMKNGVTLSPLGDFIILLAMFSFVVHEMLSKKLFKKYSAFPLSFYAFFIGAISFFPAALYEFSQNSSWINNLPSSAIFGIVYGIFFSSLTAYCLWHWGLSKMDATRAGFFYYLDPIASTIGAVVILSEKITQPFVLGAILIFLGLFFAEGRLPYHHLLQHAIGKFKK